MDNTTSNSAGFEKRSKRMLRKKGGQPGNQNAVTHGRFSAPVRAARGAAAEERAKQHLEWMKTIPKTDYGAICAAIGAHRNKLGEDTVRAI